MLYPGSPYEWEATAKATEGAMVGMQFCGWRVRGLTYMAVIDWPESNERVAKGCSTRDRLAGRIAVSRVGRWVEFSSGRTHYFYSKL
jgi:hypothetical protein